MNTLSKKYTSQFFVNPEAYNLFVIKWKAYVNSESGKNLTASDHLFYLMLRGKNYKKAFYPGRKMQDYDFPEGLHRAKYQVTHLEEIAGNLLQKDWRAKCWKILPSSSKHDGYTTDAYIDVEVEKLVASAVIKENKTVVKQFRSLSGK